MSLQICYVGRLFQLLLSFIVLKYNKQERQDARIKTLEFFNEELEEIIVGKSYYLGQLYSDTFADNEELLLLLNSGKLCFNGCEIHFVASVDSINTMDPLISSIKVLSIESDVTEVKTVNTFSKTTEQIEEPCSIQGNTTRAIDEKEFAIKGSVSLLHEMLETWQDYIEKTGFIYTMGR